ncbi:MAG: hypothetical protein N3D17_07375 [bacterium]|nr:hypothetical protein [bacterium]
MKYYLLDASAIIHYYIPSQLTTKINKLIEKKQQGEVFLFIPIFCIAETYNTFAKYYYRERKITEDNYNSIYKKFTDDVRRGKLFYQIELNRWHVMNVDYISPIEHTWFTTKKNKEDEENERKVDWYLSTFDILFIAVGIELAKMLGRNDINLVTCDDRIKTIGNTLRKLDSKKLKENKIPLETPFPEVISLRSLII